MIRDVEIKHLIVGTPVLDLRPVIGVTLTWVRFDGSTYDQTISVRDEDAPGANPTTLDRERDVEILLLRDEDTPPPNDSEGS